jgi:hypothetical protein
MESLRAELKRLAVSITLFWFQMRGRNWAFARWAQKSGLLKEGYLDSYFKIRFLMHPFPVTGGQPSTQEGAVWVLSTHKHHDAAFAWSGEGSALRACTGLMDEMLQFWCVFTQAT